jgi:hypothetical protein
VNFEVSAISAAFWHHFSHLRVVYVDPYGVAVRELQIDTCRPCLTLWRSLIPVGGAPRGDVERYSLVTGGAYAKVAGPGDSIIAKLEERGRVARIFDDTDRAARIRRRQLEHYD